MWVGRKAEALGRFQIQFPGRSNEMAALRSAASRAVYLPFPLPRQGSSVGRCEFAYNMRIKIPLLLQRKGLTRGGLLLLLLLLRNACINGSHSLTHSLTNTRRQSKAHIVAIVSLVQILVSMATDNAFLDSNAYRTLFYFPLK